MSAKGTGRVCVCVIQHPVVMMDEMLDALGNGNIFNNPRIRLLRFKCARVFYNRIVQQAVNQQGQSAAGDSDGQCVIIRY